MPDATKPEPRRPAAVKLPMWYASQGDPFAQHRKIKEVFGPILGADRLYTRNQKTFYFITGDPADTLLFPFGHPKQGLPRYDWEPALEHGDGAMLGYLVEG